MKQMSNWPKFVAVSTLLLPALTAFTSSSSAASTAMLQSIHSFTLERTSFPNDGVYQLAQASDNCRQVVVRNGVYVRRGPTVGSFRVGIIPYGRYVTVVENPGADVVVGNPGAEWMPISAPLQGYVFAAYLAPCQESPPPKNCRAVSARGGLYVQQEPSSNSNVIGVVPNGRNVTIENRGANGWVPISAPLQGYVSATYLTYCP